MSVQDEAIVEEINILKKKKKRKKRQYFIVAGVLIMICLSVCVVTGCFSVANVNVPNYESNEDNITKAPQIKPDTKKFIKKWNNKISNIRYGEYSFLNLNLDTYKLSNENVEEKIESFLNSDSKKFSKLALQLKKSPYKLFFTPLVTWIEQKLQWEKRYSKYAERMDSYELMNYVEDIVSPGKSFSDNTIDKVIQFNEFCYYFEKNKQKLYRKNYTNNIKRCSDVQEILNAAKIDFSVE